MLDHDDARALVRQGQEAGFLTHEEIALALGDEFEPVQLDEFYSALEELHIEVVDERRATQPTSPSSRRRARSRRTRSSSS